MKLWKKAVMRFYSPDRVTSPEITSARISVEALSRRIEAVYPGLVCARERNHFAERIRLALAEEQR